MDTIALLNHLRTILVALGEAEQILDAGHANFLERYDELLAELPVDFERSQYLGQDLISQIFQRYPQIAHLVRVTCCGSLAATACTRLTAKVQRLRKWL